VTPLDLHADGHALVCGASRGIGRAAALALAELGVRVTVLARGATRLEQLVPLLLKNGARDAGFLTADLDRRDELEERVGALIGTVGPVHILVNNAGGPPPGPLLHATEAHFAHAFGRHVMAAHRLVNLLLPGMREAHYGRIINVVSTSVREPLPNLGVSNTIRGAMASWAKSLSNELPPGITVNNLLPGFTRTERLDELADAEAAERGISSDEVRRRWCTSIPERRLGTPEEQANVIKFLASPQSSYMRGVSVHVDGGRLGAI
jgi:3-oxoacyl-[acyl-carrier protein] reductase